MIKRKDVETICYKFAHEVVEIVQDHMLGQIKEFPKGPSDKKLLGKLDAKVTPTANKLKAATTKKMVTAKPCVSTKAPLVVKAPTKIVSLSAQLSPVGRSVTPTTVTNKKQTRPLNARESVLAEMLRKAVQSNPGVKLSDIVEANKGNGCDRHDYRRPLCFLMSKGTIRMGSRGSYFPG
jgi:hypothetical protein